MIEEDNGYLGEKHPYSSDDLNVMKDLRMTTCQLTSARSSLYSAFSQ